jgi:lipopolysaccharide transport system ATP-binding protein
MGKALSNVRELFTERKEISSRKYHWAVKDVNFELQPGESLGIIGPNGAGKTTILKLLSHVTQPTNGDIFVNGRLSALIELGAGFHPDLTGRENIFLNGTILGMRRAEIRSRFDDIVAFAGIGDYLDTPVKRYSSGMYARLGFAIAAHVDPQILLVDEVLAVGDAAFRTKCYERMAQLLDRGTTLIFVSHDFDAVQRVCQRCLVLNRGQIAFEGKAGEAIASYSNILRQTAVRSNYKLDAKDEGLSLSVLTHQAVFERVEIIDSEGKPSTSFKSGESVRVRAQIKFNSSVESPHLACTIRHPSGQVIYDYFTQRANQSTPDFPEGAIGTVEFPLRLNLLAGIYHLGINIASHDLSVWHDRLDRAIDFVVSGGNGAFGIAELSASFQVVDIEPMTGLLAQPDAQESAIDA